MDPGPRQTLASLRLGYMPMIELANSDILNTRYWVRLLRDYRADALVLGTSTSELGIKVEQSCLNAAGDLRIPVIVVEDSPGNCKPNRYLLSELIVVESNLFANYVQQKADMVHNTSIIAGASVRYDPLRLQVKLGRQFNTKNSSHRLVWLGQPETQANLISLEILLPCLSRMGLELLFKAHPRDEGYRRGEYEQLFSGHKNKIMDVSGFDTTRFLACQPGLTLTHFSTMAIDFAFLGIPSCNVLFPESGGKIYTEMTGLKRPFLCEAGGSGTISNVSSVELELEGLLFDNAVRKDLMARFDEYFNIKVLQRPSVISAIECVLLGK